VLFSKSFTVLTTHTESAPLTAILPIAHGIINRVSVWFPPGCHGLVYCKLKHHEHTIFPSTEDMYLTGSGFPVEWDEYYESYQPPYELKFVGWSYGTVYSHVITVNVVILPRKAVLATGIVDAIKDFFGSLFPKRIFTVR